ncbi:MAG: CDP-alcohol phosphatidyltransferase family protein [FCB group bacterium]|nr:CDP-alcohol phosphatidyltransferase family protein [FCB group bacterium]
MTGDIFKIPNLISIGRLIFLIPAGYFLSQPGVNDRFYALACLTVAAATDYLDGYLARKLNQQTRLGLLLDPLCDKIMAGVLALLLIVYRDFPVWLAAVIIGRDLLIMVGGLALKSKVEGIPPSNLSGKYAFASVAVLLISHVILFDFGIIVFTGLALFFLTLSLFMYGRSLIIVLRGGEIPRFADRPAYLALRSAASWIVSLVFLYKLAEFIGWL